NLVSNARDATDGRGRIAVRALRIDLEQPQEVRTGLLAAGSYVVLVVEDDGKGIPHDLASRIFEPFVSGRSDGRGTGLGLSTVRDVAVELGGHVDFLTSSSGTSFRVWLPRYGGAAPPRPPPPPPTNRPPPTCRRSTA
ncbi:MAG TPA: ATP-binding protein, partial [Polyangiaceae bacterium]|nr:ATP-binding protein [Polyangiaceae bacterium]